MPVPYVTGTNGALVVPLTNAWNKRGEAAPENVKRALLSYSPNMGDIQTVPVYPHMETAPAGLPTSQYPTTLNPLDFMRGNNL